MAGAAEWVKRPGSPGDTNVKRDASTSYFQLVNDSSSRCLEVNNGKGTEVQQWFNPTTPWSFWFEHSRGALCNADSGLFLSVVNGEIKMSDDTVSVDDLVRFVDQSRALVTFDGRHRLEMLGLEDSNHPSIARDVWRVVTGLQPDSSRAAKESL